MPDLLRPPGPIGFIGLGNMGRPMARRLLGAGYRVVAHDLNPAALADLGAETAASPAALAREAAAVITMLPEGKSVAAVAAAIAPTMKPGSIIIDMSSSDPVGTRGLGERLAQRQVALVDAPVSGGVRRAVDGSLAIMVGGDKAAIERIRPVLAPMAKQIFETGPLGSGHAMKALNNLVSAAGLWIAAEALIVGSKFGLAPETMVDVLNASTGRNNSTEVKFKQQILSRAFGSGFSLALMAKDLTTARNLASATGGFAPLAELCAELWNEAADELGGAADHTAVVQYLERRAGKALES